MESYKKTPKKEPVRNVWNCELQTNWLDQATGFR
jgi:hypothetical protein